MFRSHQFERKKIRFASFHRLKKKHRHKKQCLLPREPLVRVTSLATFLPFGRKMGDGDYNNENLANL